MIYELLAQGCFINIARRIARPQDYERGSQALLVTSKEIRAEFSSVLRHAAFHVALVEYGSKIARLRLDPPVDFIRNVRRLHVDIRFEYDETTMSERRSHEIAET